ncbi:effector-associated constant component EACC1 [Streptomyces sp. NPDC002586]
MEVQVSLSGSATLEEFVSLVQWLRTERALQGLVRTRRRSPREDELGGAFELISVAIGSGGIATALVSSLQAWLSGRRTEQKIAVTLDGRSVEIVRNSTNAVSEEELLRLIKDALNEQ